MLQIEEIAERLKSRKLYHVSEQTGLSYGTLRAIVRGEAKNPTLLTIKALSDYFQSNQ